MSIYYEDRKGNVLKHFREFKYGDGLMEYDLLVQKEDGSFTHRGPEQVRWTKDKIHPKELKPGCIVEEIIPGSEYYGQKFVVESVEGDTIMMRTPDATIPYEVNRIKVVRSHSIGSVKMIFKTLLKKFQH